MANDKMTTGYVAKSGLIVTPKGRMLYPSLFKKSLPKGEKNEEKARYTIKLLLPKKADLTILTKAVVDARTSKFGAGPYKPAIKNWGVQKTEDVPSLAEHAEEYPVVISAKGNSKPSVVFANLAACDKEEEVYGGRWATFSFNAFGNVEFRTISFGLEHVMLLDNDEPMGGGRVRVEDAFEPVEPVETGEAAGGATSSADLF